MSRDVVRRARAVAALMCAPAIILAGCSKPGQAELRTSIVEDLQDAGLPQNQATQIADCVAPQMHAELGASSLDAIIEDGIAEAKIDADDADAGDAIFDECMSEVLDN